MFIIDAQPGVGFFLLGVEGEPQTRWGINNEQWQYLRADEGINEPNTTSTVYYKIGIYLLYSILFSNSLNIILLTSIFFYLYQFKIVQSFCYWMAPQNMTLFLRDNLDKWERKEQVQKYHNIINNAII